jgi:large conductance mechanosensitive channel
MINAFITFIITMAVIYFIFVMPMNKLRQRLGAGDIDTASAETKVLREIRDLLLAQQQGNNPPQ